MGSPEGTVALIIGIAVVLFVPVLVWVMVIAGLIQIVRGKVRDSRSAPNQPDQGSTVADGFELSWNTLDEASNC
jgi:hypothetical protein